MKTTVPGLRTQLKMGFCRKAERMRYLLRPLLLLCPIVSGLAASPITPWDTPEDNGVLLHNGWQLHDVPSLKFSDIDTAGTRVSTVSYAPSGWMKASVPGTILACMVDNGTFPDPNFGKNMEIIQSRFVNTDYVYQTKFQVLASLAGRKIWLNFEGISRDAIVFVNGTKVGVINGVWTRGKFDITACAMVGGNNGLAVIIRKGTSSSNNADTDKGQGFSGHNIQGNECHPAIPGDGNGIYAEVYLTSTGNVRIIDPFVVSDLPLPHLSPAKLTIKADLQNLTATPQSGTLKGTIGNITFQKSVSLAANERTTIAFTPDAYPSLTIASPQLWWPNGYGSPNLYDLNLTFQMKDASISDSKTVKFGIRKVTYDTSGVPGNLKIMVNGVPIFLRGGNWMSPDLFMRFDAVKADIDARFHKELGFTMVRFWKGQVPFRQVFDAMDRYGILTWCEWNGLGGESYADHNMWGFGGISNPESTEGIRDMLKRLRNHPSVVIHVGNNEQPSPPEGIALFKKQMEELHPGMLFVDHSQCLPIHNYDGPWSVQDPAWYWKTAENFGLYSEIGLPHVLSVESMRAMMPAADLWPINGTGMWSYHQINAFNTDGDKYLKKIDTQYGPSKNIEQFCAKAAAFNYENNRAIMEGAANSLWNGCTGVLLWMSKSAWANLNWSTYDYYYGVDGTYFGNKKACEPLHIQWDLRNWNVSVINATLTDCNGLTAIAEVYNLDATRKFTHSVTINAAANQKTTAFSIAKPDGLTPVHFIRLLLKNGNEVISENFYWNGVTYLDYTSLDSLPSVNLDLSATAAASGDETAIVATLRNATQSIAFMPRLCLVRATSGERVLPTYYSDNYRSLLPGECYNITMRCKTADLKGENPKLNLDGYNIAMKSLALSAVSEKRIPDGAGPDIDPHKTDKAEKTRRYTLAEKTIQHARENLPKQVSTENPELTKLVHDLYSDCTFDKLWEPALPGLPYRFFSISGAGDTSYGKCQLQWDTMFILNAWAPLDDNELVCDVFRNYWNVIDNNPEAPKGSYRYGMVPCTTNPDLPQDGFSQIPILAWGCLMIFNQTNDRELLDLCLPYLDAFLTWYATERDVDNDGLIEYGAYKKCSIADIVQTARFETFDFAAPLDGLKLTKHPSRDTGGAWYGNIEGVDQTCFLAMSERAMIEMCQRTGRIEMMKKYERNLAKRTEAIRAKMWDPETKFFYSLDRDTDKQIRVRTIQGFLPLTAGLASEKQAEELVKQLTDPSLFWSKYPVTTTAMNEPTFRPDGFWRGDMWPPTDYLIALGLNRYGYYDVAIELADRVFELVKKYDGHAYERYNGVEGLGLGVKDYCWGVTTWSIAVNTIYGVQEDYRTIVVPPHAKGRKLKLGKLEVNYPTDTSVELKTAFQREFKVIFPVKNAEIKVQCDGTTVKSVSATGAASEVTFTALPGKTYIVSKDGIFTDKKTQP